MFHGGWTCNWNIKEEGTKGIDIYTRRMDLTKLCHDMKAILVPYLKVQAIVNCAIGKSDFI